MAVGRIILGRADLPNRYFVGDVEVTKEEYEKRFPSKLDLSAGGELLTGVSPGCWPLHSEALAVHPDLRGEATEAARKAGVPTEFDKAGCPILRDRAHRAAYFKTMGYFDRQAGYGDATRGDSRIEQRGSY